MNFLDLNFYSLSRQYGTSAVFYTLTGGTVDRLTGQQSGTWTTVPVSRVVLLPTSVARSFYASSMGGALDVGKDLMAIKPEDLEFEIKPEQIIAVNDRVLSVSAVETFKVDTKSLLLVTVMEAKGITLPEIV